MSFAIYELEDDIRKLLNTDNFLNGLSVNDFIEELSKDHILKGAGVNNLDYLDPKPYIRTFESTLRQLRQLSDESSKKMDAAEADVDQFELSHSKGVIELSSEVEEFISKFDTLDSEISSITQKIEPLNQSLNKITNSRDRSMETIFLVRAYHAFYTKEKYDPLEKLRTAKAIQAKTKCSKTVKNLLTLAKKIEAITGSLPKVSKCVASIEKYSEMMEQALIDRFEIATESNDFEEMHEISEILFEFNGGSSVVQAFMNKSDLFFESDQDDGDYSIIEHEEAWRNLSDPNYEAHSIFKSEVTEVLLDRLKVAIKGQARIVQQVFSEPIPVIKTMIQRVYAQMIQNRVSTLLLFSQQLGPLAHVRILHSLYVLVGDFTRDMKEFFITNEFDENNEIGSTLEQCYYDLYIDYLLDNSYFKLEKEMMESFIYELAQNFTTLNEKIINKRQLGAKLQELEIESSQEKSGRSDHSGLENEKRIFKFMEKKRMSKFKESMKARFSDRISKENEEARGQTLDFTETGLIDMSKAQTVLRLAIEAVSRILELAPNRTPEYSLEILEILVMDFGTLYVSAGLEVAYDKSLAEFSGASQTGEPQFAFLKAFTSTSDVLFLLSSTIKKIILPCSVNNPTIRNRMIRLTNNYISGCEASLNLILGNSIEAVTHRLTHLLQRQKKRDYVCEVINTNQDYTEVCESISDFLIDVYGIFKKYLNGENLNNILIKLGMITLNLLMDHFKKFNVNSTGGIVLTQDVIQYQSVIESWGVPELVESFAILREISNLFTVQPDLINSLITEGHLASLKLYTVKQYISKRSDFSPSYFERLFGRK